jgi:thiaminase
VKVGTIYKAAYVLVALGALVNGQLPHVIFAWFAACDVLFVIGFVRFLMLSRPAAPRLAAQA